MNKTLIGILSALILIASSGAFFLEDRYAKRIELAGTQQRLTVHVAQDRINFLQQQMWAMEDRVGKDTTRMTVDQRQRYREMKTEKQRLETILQTLK